MKKILFFLFAICLSAPSSANSRQNTPDTNSAFELQYNEKTNLTCTKSRNDSNTTKCKLNTQVIDIDGNLQECTSTGWKKINKESASCTGTLAELEGKYRDIDLGTSIYNAFHGKESEDLSWIYFYDYDNDHNCIGAIKNPCKYSFENYKKADAECDEKGGKFLSNYDNMGNIILCDTNTSVTVTDEKQQPLTSAPTDTKENECIKSGGDDYKDGKCICDADKHLVEYNPENAPGYSICRCIRGYHRDGTPDENGKYPATGECVDAGDYETHEEFDSAAWRKDTEDAYRNEYDNAQSWANKGVTAASTLMTGEGAMKAAQAIAEQKADKKAEEQMAEWISKMGCEYGNGQPVDLGKEETLPGGNEMFSYKTEFKQLAEKLKATKTALNLRPGIEAEVLYDRAETGLYQYANAERQSGGFTSLSRALMNPEGADAEQWNAQKAEVAKDLTTGTLLTAGGLLVGASNILVNRNHKKEYQELEKKTKLQQSLDEAVEEILPTVELSAVQIGDESSTVLETSALTKPKLTLNTDISIPKYPITGESFATDSDVITDTNQLDNYIARINSIMEYNHMPYMQTIQFNIVGHTDRTGSATYNNQLSKRRAESVKNYLEKKLNVPSEYFTVTYYTEGKGFSECPQEGKKNKSECRRVYITVADKTERNSQN